MNKSVKEILSQVYELEGLLLLIDNHAHDTPLLVYDIIKEKATKIELLSTVLSPEIHINENPIPPSAPEVDQWHGATWNEGEMEQLGSDSCSDAPDGCDIEEEYHSDSTATMQYEEVIGNEQHQDAAVQEENYITSDTTDDDFVDDYSGDEDIDTPTETEEDVDEEEFIDDDDEYFDEEEIDEDETEEEEESDDDNEISDGDEPIRLDEALHRQMTKDLRKAFSLNDLFRYRRELFGNSEMEMKRNLHLVEAMDSYSEAEEYFFGDMQWDPESPEVMDFMKIIKKHFT